MQNISRQISLASYPAPPPFFYMGRRSLGTAEAKVDEVERCMQNTSRQISLATSDELDGVWWLDSLNLNLLLQSSNLKTPVSKPEISVPVASFPNHIPKPHSQTSFPNLIPRPHSIFIHWLVFTIIHCFFTVYCCERSLVPRLHP